MDASLQMVTRRVFGYSNKANLNRALVDAIRASLPSCETCRDIDHEVDVTPEGGEFTEAASFPGRTLQKLDAHFKAHWKDRYALVEMSGRRPTT